MRRRSGNCADASNVLTRAGFSAMRTRRNDPTFRLIGSEQIWERGADLTSRARSFVTELLTQDKNLVPSPTAGCEIRSWRERWC